MSSLSTIESEVTETPVEENTFEFLEEEEQLAEPLIYSHFHYEAATLRQLLKLEELFREHYERMKREFCSQREMADRLWVLSQRYALLISTGPCCTYPEIYAAPAEDVIISEFQAKYCVIKSSNQLLSQSLDELRTECRVFEELCSHLNFSYETDFILGDPFHKPIKFFIELVSDLFKYLHCWLLKLKLCLAQLDPVDFKQVEDYRKLMEINEDFDEYLMKGLVYCRCLQPKPVCTATRKILFGKGSNCLNDN